MTDATDRRGITPETARVETEITASMEETFGGEEPPDEGDAELWLDTAQYEATRLLGDPQPQRMFDAAAAVVTSALDTVRDTLVMLRTQREEINDEIRRLVGEEELLARMARIAQRAPGGDDAD